MWSCPLWWLLQISEFFLYLVDISVWLQVSADMANPDADMDKLMNKMEQLQNALDACNGWELERQLEVCRSTLFSPSHLKDIICLQNYLEKLTGRKTSLCP